MTKPKKSSALDTVKACCRVLEEKKAEQVQILDVGAQSSITDYLVLATATSEPHLRALRVEIEKALDAMGSRILGMEMAQESGWVVIDVFDVMIHLFLGPVREHYRLERLWRDATEVSLSKLLGAGARAGAAKAASKKPAKKPTKKRTRSPGSK